MQLQTNHCSVLFTAHCVFLREGLKETLPLLHVAHEYKYFLLRSCKANLSIVLQRSLLGKQESVYLPNLVDIDPGDIAASVHDENPFDCQLL